MKKYSIDDIFDYSAKQAKSDFNYQYSDFGIPKPPRMCENVAEKEEIERIFCGLHASVNKFLGRFEPSGINRKGVLNCGSVLTIRKVFYAKSPQVLMKYLRVMVKNGWVREYQDSNGFPSFVPVEYDKLNYKSQFD